MGKVFKAILIASLVSIAVIIMVVMGAAVREIQSDKNEVIESDTVTLNVVTTFAGGDGNAVNYVNTYRKWESITGNTVADMSAQSDETFKSKIIRDFLTGSEPDVLFFFTGVDANNFIKAGKVVSLEEITREYPDYADNIDLEKVPTSLVDGKIYAIPVTGYWEAMYVNLEVLNAAGIDMPDENYTWDKFLSDCTKIKRAGYTPIAASLGSIPHYWWEYCIFNNTGVEDHLTIPDSVDDEIGKEWVEGIRNLKSLYDLGYFPANTNSATDDETFQLFMDGKAAFLLDGSWKLGTIAQECKSAKALEKFSVTFFPATDKRKATDLIGGMSMGYYITKKAWDDPDKRKVAVSFVEYMTSTEVISIFAQHTSNVLKDFEVDEENADYNSLQIKAFEMLNKVTSLTPAVQDTFQGECRETTFDRMPDIVKGRFLITNAVEQGLRKYKYQNAQNK